MKASLTAALLAAAGALAAGRARAACEPAKPDARVQIRFTGDVLLEDVVNEAARRSCVEYRFDRALARRMLLGPVQIEVTGADLDATYAILFHTMNLAVEGRGPTRKLVATGPETDASRAVVRIEDEISKIDDQHFRITRRGLDAMLGNMSLLARSARIVPETRGGKPFGFRLFSIRPASPFGLVGLENGDVIRSINDIPMTSPDEALKAYTKMKVANAVRFGMERRGAPFALEVTISGTPTAPPPTVSPPPRRHTASRADLDAVLHQPDLQILPQAVAGKPDGVRLAPASKLATLFLLTGFTPSDVIRAINGRPVSTKESFLEAYDAAIKTNRIEFSILRAGQPKALVVDVK